MLRQQFINIYCQYFHEIQKNTYYCAHLNQNEEMPQRCTETCPIQENQADTQQSAF